MSILDEIKKIQATRPLLPTEAVDCPICGERPVFYHPPHLSGEMIVLGCNRHEPTVSFGNLKNTLSFEELTIGYNKAADEYGKQSQEEIHLD